MVDSKGIHEDGNQTNDDERNFSGASSSSGHGHMSVWIEGIRYAEKDNYSSSVQCSVKIYSDRSLHVFERSICRASESLNHNPHHSSLLSVFGPPRGASRGFPLVFFALFFYLNHFLLFIVTAEESK